MIDRELLELAAKAAGIELGRWDGTSFMRKDSMYSWNPLTDDGDALRLAVRLGITVGPEGPDVVGKSLCRASWSNRMCSLGEYGDGDKFAATRLAITRAAAEIGKQR